MNLALFDFDGTITRTDTWTPFVRFSATPARIAAGTFLFAPLMVGYKLRWISGRTSRPIVARLAFGGRRADAVRELGRRYALEALPGVMRQQALDRIAWHKQQRDTVAVVSASLDAYLVPWCESMGVHAICTCLETVNGTLSGRYVRGECCGAEKARRIRERYDVDRYSIVYAYGDTEEDREMLDLAHEKYYRWTKITDTSRLSSEHPPSAIAP